MLQSDFIALLVRRRTIIIALFSLAVVAQFVVLGSREQSYEVESILRIHPRQSQTVSAGGLRGIEIFDPFGRPDLDQILLDPKFHAAVREQLTGSSPLAAQSWGGGAFSLEKVQDSGDTFLRARYLGQTGEASKQSLEVAVVVLQEMAQEHYERSLRDGRDRLAEQVDRTASEVRRAESSLSELRLRAQLPPDATGVQSHRDRLLATIEALELRSLELIGERAELEARLRYRAEDQLDPGEPIAPERLLARIAETPAAQVVERVATRVVEAELEIARLRGTFTEPHPDFQNAVRRLEAENEIFRALFDAETPLGRHLHAALGRVADRWQEERLTTNARLISLDARRKALESLQSEKEDRLAHLRAYEGDLINQEENRRSITRIWADLDRSLRDLELLAHLSPQVLQVSRAPSRAIATTQDTVRYSAAVLCIALMIALGGGYVIEHLDPRVYGPSTLRQESGLTVLATIPRLDEAETAALDSEEPAPVTERFHELATRVVAQLSGRRVLLVAGVEDGAGKSFIAEQLARSTARLGVRTLLVDADLRAPGLSRRLLPLSGHGLADWLSGTQDLHTSVLEEALHAAHRTRVGSILRVRPDELPGPDGGGFARLSTSGPLASIVRATRWERLAFVTAGTSSSDPGALLGSARMGQFLAAARKQFPLVVIDAASLSRAADALLMARGVDGVLCVARAGSTSGPELSSRVASLSEVGAPLVGSVLNAVPSGETIAIRRPEGRRSRVHA